SFSRLAGSPLSRKANVSSCVGTTPTRSSDTRRRNSESVLALAGAIFCRSQADWISASIASHNEEGSSAAPVRGAISSSPQHTIPRWDKLGSRRDIAELRRNQRRLRKEMTTSPMAETLTIYVARGPRRQRFVSLRTPFGMLHAMEHCRHLENYPV